MAGGATGILGSLKILVDADTAKAQKTIAQLGGRTNIALGAVGSAFGLMGAEALKGGKELTDAFATLQADTGLTGEAAGEAKQQLVDLFGVNTQSFAQIGGVLASVHNDLGLVGEEAKAAAQLVLDFSKATGQEGVAATQALDDIVDSFGITMAEGAGILDQLVASHQKFGGSVADSQDALAKLAPSLNAANLEVADGIELLNLFAASGLDAADAPKALTKALATVESPEELRELIADINNTPDDFARLTKAVDLFGTKAGGKIANALKGVDLDAFGIDATQAAGSVDRASEAIDRMPLNWLTLQLRKVQGPLADFGAGFGAPLLAISSLAGPGGLRAIGAGLGAVTAGLGTKLGEPIIGALSSVPMLGRLKAVGSVWGKVLGTSLALAALPIIGLLLERAMDEVRKLEGHAKRLGTQSQQIEAGALSPEEMRAELTRTNAAIAEIRKKIVAFPDTIFGGGFAVAPEMFGLTAAEEYRDTLIRVLDEVDRGVRSAATDSSARDAYAGAWAGMSGDLEAELAALVGSAETGLGELGPAMGGSIRGAFQVATKEIAAGFGSVKQALANPPQMIGKDVRLGNMQERMAKVMDKIREATKKKDPIAQDYWEKARANLAGKMDRLRGKHVATMGEIRRAHQAAGVNVRGTWSRTGAALEAEAAGTASGIVSIFGGLPSRIAGAMSGMYQAGVNAMNQFAAGINAAIGTIKATVAAAGAAIKAMLAGKSPPPEGPLSTIDQWGGPIIDAWLGGIEKQEGHVRAVGARLGGALSPRASMGQLALAGAHGRGGGGDRYYIGTLIADEGGLDELDHRLDRRRRRRDRGGGRRYNEPG